MFIYAESFSLISFVFHKVPHYMKIDFRSFTFLILILFQSYFVSAQAPMTAKHVGEIQLELQHMQVLGSVLYIAAHPDDENTRLISYFSKEKGYRTAYLSLTRGDGGQNLIGDEKGSSLGVLRTQELLAARRIDGGEQMFSRAVDFGYSKNPEETLSVWDKEKILGDVVWAIRKFRPDIIVTRFAEPDRGGGGHGHHTTSAMLAREAFHLASKADAYPEQLEYVEPWQPKRIFWNLYTWRFYQPSEDDLPKIIKLNIDQYNPLLGKGYGEIAAEARSKHKCQAFGTAKLRGEQIEQILLIEGPMAEEDPMEDIDTSWDRIEGGESVSELFQDALDEFDPMDPSKILPHLLSAYQQLDQMDGYWPNVKKQELKELIAYCAGLYFEANSNRATVARNDTVTIGVSAIQRSDFPVTLEKVVLSSDNQTFKEVNVDSLLNGAHLFEQNISIPLSSVPTTEQYWLTRPAEKGTYTVEDQRLIGLPETPPAIEADLTFSLSGTTITMTTPVVYKYVDRAIGELYRPFIVTPATTANISQKVYLFSNGDDKQLEIVLKSHKNQPYQEKYTFEVPPGWTISPSSMEVDFTEAGEEQRVSLTLTPPSTQSVGNLIIKDQNGNPVNSLQEIAYDHIPTQLVFQPSTTRLVKIDITKKGNKIAYIMGSGDEVPMSLEQIGYRVDILGDEQVQKEKLKEYDAVVAGIRVYNTRDRIAYLQDEILSYVEDGGTYIVQYNTSYAMKSSDIGPYPLKIARDRVTVEEAPITLLKPEHPIFNKPNKISAADFDGWVQERGLYFADEWDERYEALTQSNDPGEDPLKGALLVAQYGKGNFVYTGFSFFRELPAGVPGAFRLFTNMVSLGK